MLDVSLISVLTEFSDRIYTPNEIEGKIKMQRSGCPPHLGRCIFIYTVDITLLLLLLKESECTEKFTDPWVKTTE